MDSDTRFLKKAIEHGIITKDEAESYHRAYEVVRRHGQSKDLPEWLVSRGLITKAQRNAVKTAMGPPPTRRKNTMVLQEDPASDRIPIAAPLPPPPPPPPGPTIAPRITPQDVPKVGDEDAPVGLFKSDDEMLFKSDDEVELGDDTAPFDDSEDDSGATPTPDISLADCLKASPFTSRNKQASRPRGMRFGPYKVLREIARGGMGAVYEVKHDKLGGPFALKVLLSRNRATERQRRRFMREVETARRINHPGIVRIIDAGTTDGIDYLTMEFLRGRPLDDVLRDDDPPSERRLAEIIRDLARALNRAHDEGVIHRDLKPANIIIRDDNGKPVVTDFGLAKDLLDDTVLSRSGTVIGTPRYLSPEQVMALHDKIGPTTDIYALGVILYEGLVGDRPFDADSVETLYQMIEDDPPIPPRDIDAKVSAELEFVCLKAMEKEQSDRYACGEDMAADLDSWLQTGRLLSEHGPEAEWQRKLRALKRTLTGPFADRVVLVLFVVFFLLFVALAVVVLFDSTG